MVTFVSLSFLCYLIYSSEKSDHDPPARSRSRSRSLRRRSFGVSSKQKKDHQSRRKDKGDSKDTGGNKRKNGNKNSKSSKNSESEYTFSSPRSFEEAWSGSFFSPSILLLITTLGFVVGRIPVLHNIPIGGHWRFCKDTWKKVTSNNWVSNVISDGYRIPL